MHLWTVLIGKAKIMDNQILVYFRHNIQTVSKEEILKALENALKSAECWREAYLHGFVISQDYHRKAAMVKVAVQG